MSKQATRVESILSVFALVVFIAGCGSDETQPESNPLSVPTGVNVSKNSSSYIDVTWVGTDARATHYEVFRTREDSSTVVLVGQAFDMHYRDTLAVPAWYYSYKVRAVFAEGVSAYSDDARGFRMGYRFANVSLYQAYDASHDLTRAGLECELYAYGFVNEAKPLLLFSTYVLPDGIRATPGTFCFPPPCTNPYCFAMTGMGMINTGSEVGRWNFEGPALTLPRATWDPAFRTNNPPQFIMARVFAGPSCDWNDPWLADAGRFQISWRN